MNKTLFGLTPGGFTRRQSIILVTVAIDSLLLRIKKLVNISGDDISFTRPNKNFVFLFICGFCVRFWTTINSFIGSFRNFGKLFIVRTPPILLESQMR